MYIYLSCVILGAWIGKSNITQTSGEVNLLEIS